MKSEVEAHTKIAAWYHALESDYQTLTKESATKIQSLELESKNQKKQITDKET